MPTPQRINRKLDTYAQQIHQLALNDPTLADHYRNELAHCDTAQGETAGKVTGTTDHDPVLRWVLARMRIKNHWDNYTTAIDQLGLALENVQRKSRALGTERAPAPQCRDGGFGKDLSPELTADVATCLAIPHKVGLCNAHYLRWWRERRDAGVDVTDMHQGAA